VKRSGEEIQTAGRLKYLRSSVAAFDWKNNCFLCGEQAVIDRKHPQRNAVHEAKSDRLTETILMICDERQDEWAFQVKGRISTCGNLHAAAAVYHGQCHRDFVKFNSDRHFYLKTGRPANIDASAVFETLCDKLESEESEIHTVDELVQQMQSLCGAAGDTYFSKYMKQKLQDNYRKHIFFSDVSGRKNVVCFHNSAQRVISDKWYADRQADVTKES